MREGRTEEWVGGPRSGYVREGRTEENRCIDQLGTSLRHFFYDTAAALPYADL